MVFFIFIYLSLLIDSPIKISNNNSLLTPDINELNKGIDFYKLLI